MIKKDRVSYMFIGPSSYSIKMDIPCNMKIMPPAKRGDINNLVASNPPGSIVLVDGTYHSYPAVSHAEIRSAIKSGWQVWGLSSMGAIRAVELKSLGMKGFGNVYSMFAKDDDLPDDYVALIHGNEPPYIPISEPLIHIDFFLKELVEEHVISYEDYIKLLDSFSNMWFGYRTIKKLKQSLNRYVLKSDFSDLDHKFKNFQNYRVKSLDVLSFLSTCNIKDQY
ncbi:hypothetical protein FQP87_03690 [Vibrio tasmaniensis]|nr:hypothetical protein FQP87_03690 [Vibrio tasmaniensis]